MAGERVRHSHAFKCSAVTGPIGMAGLSKLSVVRLQESAIWRGKHGVSMLGDVAFSLRNCLFKLSHEPRPGTGQPFEATAGILEVAERIADGFNFLQTAKPRPEQVPAGQSRLAPL